MTPVACLTRAGGTLAASCACDTCEDRPCELYGCPYDMRLEGLTQDEHDVAEDQLWADRVEACAADARRDELADMAEEE